MKNRENRGAPSADLLACFPSRAHLALLPKPICSPARSSEPTKRLPHHRRKRSTGGGMFGGAGQLSPVPWAKTSKQQIKARDGGGGGPESSEPTSPKVTCAGQIKARPNGPSSNCRNWQSVMEEIERIHSDRKQRTLGFKKEVMQFLTCLRSIRFDFNFRCLGSFPGQTLSESDDEDEEVEDDEKEEPEALEEEEGSRTVFSKWFTVLQEDEKKAAPLEEEGEMVPPANALLLMRCRSAPAQSRLKRRETEDEDGDLQDVKEEEDDDDEEEARKEADVVDKEENRRKKKRESLEMVMKYDPDFYKLVPADEIAKETWVDTGLMETLCRSRSCKR